jgi:hypothetical protein
VGQAPQAPASPQAQVCLSYLRNDALSDASYDVRIAGIQALAQVGERAPIVPLMQCLTSDNEGVRAAAQALGQLGAESVPRAVSLHIFKDARRSQLARMESILRIVRWITDWPTLALIGVLDAMLIWPVATEQRALEWLPLWRMNVDTWWEVALAAFSTYVVVYLVLRISLWHIVYRVQSTRIQRLESAESTIRRQVSDTGSGRLSV